MHKPLEGESRTITKRLQRKIASRRIAANW